MMVITVTPLEVIEAAVFANKVATLVAMAESLFGAVDVDVRVPPMPLEGDPAVAKWIAEGSPMAGCTWSGDYSDVDGHGEMRLTVASN